ncbi:MAG: DUF4917 family protein [Spirochaetia bacterium]|nr:DUF4917 family protein [Spirochaetia bacterium]
MKLETYPGIQKELRKKDRDVNLLLGNGFSMAFDAEIFSYNALHQFIAKIDNELLSKLFEIVNTKNFELVMQQLDNFSELVEALGADQSLQERIDSASSQLKASLIDAVKELHPEHVFKISDNKNEACASFLRWYLENGGKVFTTHTMTFCFTGFCYATRSKTLSMDLAEIERILTNGCRKMN